MKVKAALAAFFCAAYSYTVHATTDDADADVALAAPPRPAQPVEEARAGATPPPAERWNLHGQVTYIAQWKNNFASPYRGAKSLRNRTEGDIAKTYTLTATAFAGVRLWQGAEVYYNPEMFEGIPFSDLSGLGSFTNGELQKGTAIPPIYYTARAFFRQTFGLGGGQQYREGQANQLAGGVDANRVVISYGAFSALDFFDQNAYSHDGRTQFMNWAIISGGAYDYAANSRGLSFGLVGEYYTADWVLRAGRLALPYSPNTLPLNHSLRQDYGDQIELTHSHTLLDQPGKLRALVFRNTGVMANYQEAVALGNQGNTVPNIFSVRHPGQRKRGYLLNAEQAITGDIGAFARWSWNSGQAESISYDIGRSLSGGVIVNGNRWSRPRDSFGVAFAVNGLSAAEIAYLQRGGVTMMIGDGALSYRPEQIMETFYALSVYRGFQFSADYQRIANPGYNAARGPVNFFGIRVHMEM